MGSVSPRERDDLGRRAAFSAEGLRAPRPERSALTSVFVPNLPVPAFPPLDVALGALLAR
jgi:hypothetical protein